MVVKPNTDAGKETNIKGRLNFASVGTGPSHIITLNDSDFAKTIAAQLNRPPNDPDDSYIGYDVGTGNPHQTGISFGAPQSLSNYIGNNGDGINWKERLTATLKHFKTDVQIDGNLVITGSIVQRGPQTQGVTLSRNPTRSAPELTTTELAGELPTAQVIQGHHELSLPQQFTYTLTERDGTLASGRTTPSIYVNRAAKLRLSEIYCEVEAGTAVINLRNAGRQLLSSSIVCTPSGSASTTFVQGQETMAVGERLDHDTGAIGQNAHSLKVILSYFVE